MLKILDNLKLLTSLIYGYTKDYPKEELYGLVSQMRRAIISVRLNIREGNTFFNDKKRCHFTIALGSLEEVDECMIISLELRYVTAEQYEIYKKEYWLNLNMLRKLTHSDSST